jgi:peptide/nickel transport system ATP-binding protein/oligopeptide transport system ATP-binding protein
MQRLRGAHLSMRGERIMSREEPILSVQELRTYFFTPEGTVKAVDDVSFALNRGETLGIVGESGCGKSVSAYSILRLIPDPPGKIVSGRILFKGEDLLCKSKSEMRKIRGNRISIIFQEPMTSLNPVFTIGRQIMEAFVLHRGMARKEALRQAVEMLKIVRIPRPDLRVRDYPHQLSGGMRQRAMIAMALACHPEILIADEPTTALDVTIQAQILDLMVNLKEEFGTAIILITHALGVVAEMAQRVAVMYAGKIVEEGPVEVLFDNPRHPYTQGLLRSIPRIGGKVRGDKQRLNEVAGIVPSLNNLPPGCAFSPRCLANQKECREAPPPWKETREGLRYRCWMD